MTLLALAAGLATLAALVALDYPRGSSPGLTRWMRGYTELVPGVALAAAAVVVASGLLRATTTPLPEWLSALTSVALASLLVLVVAAYRRRES